MAQSAPSPPIAPLDERDSELGALPAPRRRERLATALVMVAALVASLGLGASLVGEIRYALSPTTPVELGELAQATLASNLTNRYVRGAGLLATHGAIRYERPMEGDSFRLANVAGNPKVWVEIRVPEGMEGPKFVPPTSFVGRLVPFSTAGLRHAGLDKNVSAASSAKVEPDAWLLIDGASPRASRWSLALSALLAYFAIWNAIGLYRLARPPRELRG